MPDPQTIVEVEGLDKTYASDGVSVEALKKIRLRIDRGEFVTLAGPSGSGKTTLLNLIGALDQPTRGRVVVLGEDLARLGKNELANFRLRRIGFVFQAYNLINVLTARENVEYIMLLQGVSPPERRGRTEEILIRVGLKDYCDTLPTRMSGGQQQRVAVARAIAARPELVLADEPTANLDSATGASLIDLFRELSEAYQTTFVISSHDPMVIEKTKRLIRLHDGEITEDRGTS